MKKFIISVCILVVLIIAGYVAYYQFGIHLNLGPDREVTTFMKTDESTIYIEKDGAYVPFEIRGVDLGVGIPGEWSTDFAIDKKTYLRWFQEIQDLGANTIRIYTIMHQDFYDAFYEYNTQRERDGLEPLYLIHGVWVDDYILFSHASGYDKDFLPVFLTDCRTMVDIIHGNRSLPLGYQNRGSGDYRHDISSWVIGYILGVEWEDSMVIYTNQVDEDRNSYQGKYLYTTEDAKPFEAMLAQVGDNIIQFETDRYHQQRLVAFANWPTTDPFVYPDVVAYYMAKKAVLDIEHIKSSDNYISGLFISYHIYSYYPDYLGLWNESQKFTMEEFYTRLDSIAEQELHIRDELLNAPDIREYLQPGDCYDSYGRFNTYIAYLRALCRYHTKPVVISEYGVTTGRGMAQEDIYTGRNQGHMTEQEQGQALIDCFKDIRAAGCAGSCVFSWQDEWFKRTWNTMHAVDLDKTAYWSDYQTNEQYFGLLAFDPGEEKSVCYVDGDVSEWTEDDLVVTNGDMDLSMKYDEKFLYFLVHKEGFDQKNDTLYVPIDTNPKVGSTYAEEQDVAFERPADFLMVIHGKDDSRLLVQERYEVLMSTYHKEYYAFNPYFKENTPALHSPVFKPIYLPLTTADLLPTVTNKEAVGKKYETGILRYGNANPDSEDFDSLSDFMFCGDYVEVRVPWELLNFSDPSNMMIHDDYYECYGIENYHIDEMYVGVTGGQEETRAPMTAYPLEGWGKDVTYHERLKRSYYMLQEYWTGLDQAE